MKRRLRYGIKNRKYDAAIKWYTAGLKNVTTQHPEYNLERPSKQNTKETKKVANLEKEKLE